MEKSANEQNGVVNEIANDSGNNTGDPNNNVGKVSNRGAAVRKRNQSYENNAKAAKNARESGSDDDVKQDKGLCTSYNVKTRKNIDIVPVNVIRGREVPKQNAESSKRCESPKNGANFDVADKGSITNVINTCMKTFDIADLEGVYTCKENTDSFGLQKSSSIDNNEIKEDQLNLTLSVENVNKSKDSSELPSSSATISKNDSTDFCEVDERSNTSIVSLKDIITESMVTQEEKYEKDNIEKDRKMSDKVCITEIYISQSNLIGWFQRGLSASPYRSWQHCLSCLTIKLSRKYLVLRVDRFRYIAS